MTKYTIIIQLVKKRYYNGYMKTHISCPFLAQLTHCFPRLETKIPTTLNTITMTTAEQIPIIMQILLKVVWSEINKKIKELIRILHNIYLNLLYFYIIYLGQSRISTRAQHICIELESFSWRGVLDTTLCDKIGQ